MEKIGGGRNEREGAAGAIIHEGNVFEGIDERW